MASQLMAVQNNPRLRRNQTAELNARLQYLPQIMEARRRNEDISRQEAMNAAQRAQWDRNYNLAKKQQKFQKKQANTAMGLEAGKLGLSILGSYGPTSKNPSRGSLGSLFSSFGGKSSGSSTGPGLMSNLNLGSMVGGGLAGYGASKVLGGKNKFAKAAIGAGVGGLLSGLTGGGWSGAISGGLGGGLGGLFG